MRRALLTMLLTAAVHLVAASSPPWQASPVTVTQIAASWHILALLSDGTVSAQGENRFGQLGRPAGAPLRYLPVGRVALPERAVQVAAADQYASYALLEHGSVWAWGNGEK